MKGLTKQTERRVIEIEREIHVLDSWSAQIKTDGDEVWTKDVDGGVPIDQFRAAVEAIKAGVEKVEFHGSDASLKRNSEGWKKFGNACIFNMGKHSRYTSAKDDSHADLTDLLDAAE